MSNELIKAVTDRSINIHEIWFNFIKDAKGTYLNNISTAKVGGKLLFEFRCARVLSEGKVYNIYSRRSTELLPMIYKVIKDLQGKEYTLLKSINVIRPAKIVNTFQEFNFIEVL